MVKFRHSLVSTTMAVSILGINKIKLLKALWRNAKPAFYFYTVNSQAFDGGAKAQAAVKKYIDYYDGRCIKTDISADSALPALYDREYGAGAFQRVVNSL